MATWADSQCKRIISQSPYITHQLTYLGLKDCIVGTSRYDGALGLPQTGGIIDPDAAAITQLHPDIWLTSTWTSQQVFQASLPQNALGLRLASFDSMAQVHDNLTQIATLSQSKSAQQKALEFDTLWQEKIKQVNGKHKKTLLLSSCGKQPYAYGKNSWLGDLFSQAGFDVIDFTEHVTHLGKNKNEQQTLALIQSLQPDLIIVFHQQTAEACGLLDLPKISQLLVLDGDKFLHPAPTLLEGIDQLIDLQAVWQ